MTSLPPEASGFCRVWSSTPPSMVVGRTLDAPVARHADFDAAQHGGDREQPLARRQLRLQQVDLRAAQDVGDVAALELAAGDAAVAAGQDVVDAQAGLRGWRAAERALPGSGTPACP